MGEAIKRIYRRMIIDELRSTSDGSFEMAYPDSLYIDLIFMTEGCTASYLADTIGIARSAVSVRLNRLEKQGYIRRRRSKADGRVQIIELSEDCQRDLERYYASFMDIDGILSERFSEDDIGLFSDMMGFLAERWSDGSARAATDPSDQSHEVDG